MEALVANFVDPGDRVVCGVNGLFGVRMADELARAGADVVQVKADWGRAIDPEQLIEAAQAGDDRRARRRPRRDVDRRRAVARRPRRRLPRARRAAAGRLRHVAGRTSAAPRRGRRRRGVLRHAEVPELPARPGPVHRRRARDRQAQAPREQPGRSWYFDLALVLEYWSPGAAAPTGAAPARAYHHTAPINMMYALREALRIAVGEEWLPTTWERHRRAHHALKDALAVFGCERLAPRRRAAAPAARGVPAGGRRRGGGPPRRCCSSTGSRSPAASGRSPASCGGSGSWAWAPSASPRSAS